MAKMGKWMQSLICQQTLGADNDIVSGRIRSVKSIISSPLPLPECVVSLPPLIVAAISAASKEGPMPGDSAETLDDLRQECAVLRQRVAACQHWAVSKTICAMSLQM